MKLLIDEMWPPQIAVQLRALGHDAIAVAESSELRSKQDTAILAFAHSDSRSVLTENVSDFRRLAAIAIARGDRHAGLIFTTNRCFPRRDSRTVGRIVIALDQLLRSGIDLNDREHWLQ